MLPDEEIEAARNLLKIKNARESRRDYVDVSYLVYADKVVCCVDNEKNCKVQEVLEKRIQGLHNDVKRAFEHAQELSEIIASVR